MINVESLTNLSIHSNGEISVGQSTTNLETGEIYFFQKYEIKSSLGMPFFVYNKLNREFLIDINELKDNLEHYLEEALIKEIVNNSEKPIKLGYLRGRSLDFSSKICHIGMSDPIDEKRNYKETFVTMQFYELVEKSN